MSAAPDPIVKEETIRDAVGTLCEGAAGDARAVGKLPDVAAIEKFAQKIVAEQVARHEERCAKIGGIPSKAPVAPVLPDAHMEVRHDDLGEVTHIVRPLGIVDWNTGTNEMRVRPGASSKLAKRHARRMTRYDRLLKVRLDFLMTKPEWETRIVAAFHRGCQVAIMRGIYTDKEIASMGADEVVKIADDSIRLFGDWKDPPKQPNRITIHAR